MSDIPVLFVQADNLPQAWEKTVLKVWLEGIEVKTQYDSPTNPPSKDATVMVSITNPFAEPRIHKNFPGGPEELEVYRQEVVDGIHDHWIDPEAGKWTYTYHQRLFEYLTKEAIQANKDGWSFPPVNQIKYIIDSLVDTYYTRRAQAITWQPTVDPPTGDPPCLQRIWCRMLRNEDDSLVLNMNTHWRSRDLYKAWFMNVYALTELQKIIAMRVSEKLGENVLVGRYMDISDSLHIYGCDFKVAEPEIKKMMNSSYIGRAWDTTHPAFEMMTDEARKNLASDPDYYAKGNK